MKKVILSGSMAYDRIMDFPEKFSDHILADKIHDINVCFLVDGVTENYGGTAGNIAYALRLMGENPAISATIGRDHHSYFDWLAENGIAKDGIVVIPQEMTAGAYINTDSNNNQITAFNPGAMKFSSGLDIAGLDPEQSMVLVSPGNLDDMVNYPRQCRARGIEYIFDPGQQLPVLKAEDLREVLSGCLLLIVNDYEFSLILDKTGMSREELLQVAENTIITLGGKGSDLYEKGGCSRIPAFTAARVVDPTGAGDAYRGGLLSGLLQGRNLRESAIRGSVCASFAVESLGTQVYRFTAEEFAKRLAAI
jgi:adenosine kinase